MTPEREQRAQAALITTMAQLLKRHGLTAVVTAACDIAQARAAAAATRPMPTDHNARLAQAILTRRNHEHV